MAEHPDPDDEEQAAIFEMMRQHFDGFPTPKLEVRSPGFPAAARPSPGSDSPTVKRRRVELEQDIGAAEPSEPSLPSDWATHAIVQRPQPELPSPPQRVIDAFSQLDLPLTATARDVEKQLRRLARGGAHPDKAPPHLRQKAARAFRGLQDAKALLLSWFQDRPQFEADACSDSGGECEYDQVDEDPCEDGDKDAETYDPCAASDASGSEGEREDLKACGLPKAGESPEASDSDDSEERQQTESALRLAYRHGGHVYHEDNVLQQATNLSHFMATASKRLKMCEECMTRPSLKDSSTCKRCGKELKGLLRRITRD